MSRNNICRKREGNSKVSHRRLQSMFGLPLTNDRDVNDEHCDVNDVNDQGINDHTMILLLQFG